MISTKQLQACANHSCQHGSSCVADRPPYCLNYTICELQSVNYSCVCSGNFTGYYCDIAIDETNYNAQLDGFTQSTALDGTTHSTALDGTTHSTTLDGTTHDTTFDGFTHDTTFDGTTHDTALGRTANDKTLEGSTHDCYTALDGTTQDSGFTIYVVRSFEYLFLILYCTCTLSVLCNVILVLFFAF